MSFPLLGNVKARAFTENAILNGKIPHAILIEGEKGQGKKTLALYIAKAFLCGGENKPCEKCDNCRLINASSHPDIIRLTLEDNKKFISVDQIRTLKEKVYIKPHIANGKVFIIEDADRMNQNSQNALLKVLEEPPENTCFILLMVNKEAMLSTVISRCALLSLSSPDKEDGIKYLLNNTKCEEQKAEELLDGFHGNIGAALTFINKKGENDAYKVAKEFVSLIFSGSSYNMLKLLHPYSKDRVFMDDFFSELQGVVADELKSINKNGVRAKVLFSLFEDTQKYKESLKFNVNIPLLISTLTSNIISKMR